MATVEFLTPAALYAGHGGEAVQVDPTEKGVEFGQKLGIGASPQFEGLTIAAQFTVECDAILNAGLFVDKDAIFNATVDLCGALNVKDQNILIGNVDLPTDLTADGGGLTLLGDTGSDKTIKWLNATKAWTFNQDVGVQKQLSVGALTAPVADASIDLKATNKALLHNRLTTVQRDALAVVKGMVVYNTTTDDVEFYNGVSWVSMLGGNVTGAPSSTDNAIVRFNGTDGKNIQNSGVFIDDSGNLGVGSPNPSEKLEIDGNVKVNTVVDNTIYAQLSSSVNQEPADTNPTVITYNTQDALNGLTHSTTVNSGEITVDTAGIYFVSPQAQVGKDSGAVKTDFDMFLQVDRGSGFVDEPNLNIKFAIKDADITDVIISNFTIQLNVGDKIRMMQRVSTAAVGLGLKNTDPEVGPPTVPRTPSIIFTIYRVGGI